MGDYDDYPYEHDRMYQEDRGFEGGRAKPPREDIAGREYRERERYDREPPRDFDRRRDERDHYDRRDEERDRPDRRDDERDRYDRRDEDRRRPPPRLDERYDRGPGVYREQPDRRDVRSDPRDYGRDFGRDFGRERRRSRSRERRRSRSRERYDHRRDDREGGRRGRGGDGRGPRRDHHSDEEEGYGGYKPRKRQAPPDPSKYDKPLPPGAGPGYISDPFYYLRQNVPSDPAEAQRLWLEQQLRSRQMVLQQQAASAAAASAKTQRELYIGNLVPGHVTDVALRQLFNSALAHAFPVSPGAEPVVNVNLHSDGRYAFVEFRTPEMATAALSINGQVQLLGQTISVGRPSGYVDPQKAAAAAQAAAQALAAFQAGDMAALAANATAAGMNLAQLGLANLILPKAAGTDAATDAAADAVAVAAAGTGAGAAGAAAPSRETTPAPGAAAEASEATGNGAAEELSMQQHDGHQPQQQAGQGDKAAEAEGGAANGDPEEEMAAEPSAMTPFFSVLNMLTADMLVDDEEYEAVIEDLRDECDRHAPGGVVAVKVPRPPPEGREASDKVMGTGHYGKAFVAFRDIAAAQRAYAAIHGRLFAGSTVHVQYITEDEYAAV